jgi:putative IMPACT (imprinted ancient) family translation regulator
LHAQRIPAIPLKRFRLSLRQEDAGKARNLLERHKARILEEAYGRNADYTVEIAEERYRNLSDAIQDLTQGEATITQIEPHREK